MNAWITATAFVTGLLVGTYGLFYLSYRYQAALDWLLNQWWGAPTALIGGAAGILGFAVLASLSPQVML